MFITRVVTVTNLEAFLELAQEEGLMPISIMPARYVTQAAAQGEIPDSVLVEVMVVLAQAFNPADLGLASAAETVDAERVEPGSEIPEKAAA